jgi:hypothetical protein
MSKYRSRWRGINGRRQGKNLLRLPGRKEGGMSLGGRKKRKRRGGEDEEREIGTGKEQEFLPNG